MKENAIRESIGIYIPDLGPERDMGRPIRYKNQYHPAPFNQEGGEEGRIRESIEDISADQEFFNMLENCSIRGEIVSTTVDLLTTSKK